MLSSRSIREDKGLLGRELSDRNSNKILLISKVYWFIRSSSTPLCFIFRTLKKADLQLKIALDGLGHIKSIYDKTKSQVDALPKDDGSLFDKRKELQREVDIVRHNLAKQVRRPVFELSALETVTEYW